MKYQMNLNIDLKIKEIEEADTKAAAKGNKLTSKKLHLNLSSTKRQNEQTTERSLQLDGKVTSNEHASSNLVLCSRLIRMG